MEKESNSLVSGLEVLLWADKTGFSFRKEYLSDPFCNEGFSLENAEKILDGLSDVPSHRKEQILKEVALAREVSLETQLVIFSGVSCSGKTIGSSLFAAQYDSSCFDADNVHTDEGVEAMRTKNGISPEQRKAWSSNFQALVREGVGYGTLFVACSALTVYIRQELRTLAIDELGKEPLFIDCVPLGEDGNIDVEVLLQRAQERDHPYIPKNGISKFLEGQARLHKEVGTDGFDLDNTLILNTNKPFEDVFTEANLFLAEKLNQGAS